MEEKEMIERMNKKAFDPIDRPVRPTWIHIDNAIEIARDYNASQKEILDDMAKLVQAVVDHGKIKWDFDEQQADPIHKNWYRIAEECLRFKREVSYGKN